MSSKETKKKEYKKYFDLSNYKRVIELSKTPTRDEFVRNALLVTATVTAAGFLGFTIFQIMSFIPM